MLLESMALEMVAGVFYDDLFFALGLISVVLVEGGTFIPLFGGLIDSAGDLCSSEKLIAGSLSLPSYPSQGWQEELFFRKRGLKGLLRCCFQLSNCFWHL
jgi:hypothetical protein